MSDYKDRQIDAKRYIEGLKELGRTMLQIVAGRQYAGAESVTFDDLRYAVPSKLDFFVVGSFLADGEKSGILEPVEGRNGKGYRIVQEKLDEVRSMWNI